MSDRYVHALWCDDIRQEVGNKPSFMGVYTGGLTIPTLPTVLPRLAVWTWVAVPLDIEVRSVNVRVVRDDGFVFVDLTPTVSDLAAAVANPVQAEATRRIMMFGLAIGPVELPIGCRFLDVAVLVNDEPIAGPKLWITPLDQAPMAAT